jgi:hypothetical protein
MGILSLQAARENNKARAQVNIVMILTEQYLFFMIFPSFPGETLLEQHQKPYSFLSAR